MRRQQDERGRQIMRLFSRRDALKLGGVALAGALLPGYASGPAPTTVTVGNPSHPALLPSAILDAYNRGMRDITLTAGTYVIPDTGKNSIEFAGWNNATIRGNGSTIVFEGVNNRPIMLAGCNNVTIENVTLQFAGVSYTQGRIKAIGEDAAGRYLDWQIDAGYPTEINPAQTTYNVIDQQTRLLKVGTGDSGAGEARSIGTGIYRLGQMNGSWEGAAVGDWLVCRAPGGSSIIQLDDSRRCTLRGITLKNAGFAAFFETGGDGDHRYTDCVVTRGPKPAGATEEQLVACGADGFHSTGTRVGPTIEHCHWDGVLLDDCIAIHGSFQTVVRAEGNLLVLEKGNRAGFAVNEPVRISSGDGFFAQAICTAVRTLESPDRNLELTLDRALSVPAGAKAGNPERCGKSYKILGCTLGNTRSRGILVKADDGLIQGCLVEGCGMSAVSIGPEYYWGEANYCWNVTVAGNHFRHNSLRNNQYADGVIFLHGDGAKGNRNINIINNRFEDNYSPYMMNLGWAEGVMIIDNLIDAPSPLPLSEPGCIIRLHDIRQVAFNGNTYSKPGPSVARTVDLGSQVEGVIGNDDSGIRLIK
ncbi:MAG: hypothetical protein ABSE48_19830 [Verrucomicrobiota bacterium]